MGKWISIRRRAKISHRLLNIDHLHEIEMDEFTLDDDSLHYVISFSSPMLTSHVSFKSKRKRNKAYEKIRLFIHNSMENLLEVESDIK